MKVLIATPLSPPDPGGPSYYSASLYDAFQAMGEEVEMISFRDVRGLPPGIRHFVFFLMVFFKLRKMDALIMLDTVSVAIPAAIAGRILRKKMVVRVGGDFLWERYVERTGEKILLSDFYLQERPFTKKERFIMWLQKRYVFRDDVQLAFNTAWQYGLWAEPYGLKDENAQVIGNAFDINMQKQAAPGEVFLAAWRPTAFKNIDTLEKAYELAKAEDSTIQLEIYKNIPRESLHEYMMSARALIIPSLSELAPNMAYEALAMGIPVILTQDCGLYDELKDVALWVDPLSPEDIASKMLYLQDEENYFEMKERVKYFTRDHSYMNIANEFLFVLKK